MIYLLYYFFTKMQNQTNHSDKVSQISKEVAEAFNKKQRLYIFHNSSNTTREINFKKGAVVDVSDLNKVLEINSEEQYAIVEPNVSMGKLVSETLKKGLVPPVVMEFPAITVGGAIQGGAVESNSYKHGSIHHCCDEYEVVLGNGRIVKLSPTDNPELFWGLACSYGSLAIITKVKLRLVRAAKFVKIRYIFTENTVKTIETIRLEKNNSKTDFLDAILFGQNSGVVMAGEMTDVCGPNQKPLTFSKPSDNWFYLHVQSKVQKQDFLEELLPLTEYLFRYNRGAFWMSKFYFDYFKLPFTKITRRILNRWLDAKNLYRAPHAANLSQIYILQDFDLPYNKVIEFLEYVNQSLPTYPLWLCPLLPTSENDRLAPNHIETDLVINVGIYTQIGNNYEKFIKLNRSLETLAEQLKGRKMLYAHQYYPVNEFWRIYDKNWYDGLRAKCFAGNIFPDVYEKTFVDKKYKSRFWKGVFELLKSPDKLTVKE